jgi:hypothetical protein
MRASRERPAPWRLIPSPRAQATAGDAPTLLRARSWRAHVRTLKSGLSSDEITKAAASDRAPGSVPPTRAAAAHGAHGSLPHDGAQSACRPAAAVHTHASPIPANTAITPAGSPTPAITHDQRGES